MRGTDIKGGLEWDYFPAVELMCLSVFGQQTGPLLYWPVRSSYWSLWPPNLLIDFLCCVAWDRSGGQPLAWHSGSDCSPRPCVWNLSSLMHQAALVSLLPKQGGERIGAFCVDAFERRSNSSFQLIIGPNRAKPERPKGHSLICWWKSRYLTVWFYKWLIIIIT